MICFTRFRPFLEELRFFVFLEAGAAEQGGAGGAIVPPNIEVGGGGGGGLSPCANIRFLLRARVLLDCCTVSDCEFSLASIVPVRTEPVSNGSRFDVRFERISNLSNISLKIHCLVGLVAVFIGCSLMAILKNPKQDLYMYVQRATLRPCIAD